MSLLPEYAIVRLAGSHLQKNNRDKTEAIDVGLFCTSIHRKLDEKVQQGTNRNDGDRNNGGAVVKWVIIAIGEKHN